MRKYIGKMIGIDSVTWNGDFGHIRGCKTHLTFGDLLKGGYKKKREDGCFTGADATVEVPKLIT